MSVRPITDTLRLLQGGVFLDQCSAELAEMVKAIEETGKPGKLTITLDIKRSSGALAVTASVKAKTPEVKPDSDLLWSTVEGNLTPSNPAQQKLDLKPVEMPSRVLQNVETPERALQTAVAR